jgi:prophage regulatory protein
VNTDKILRWREVHERTGLSRTTVWRETNAKRFPEPVRITAQAVGWRESDIDAWIGSRQAVPAKQAA